MQQRPSPSRPFDDAARPDARRFVRDVEPLLGENDLPGLVRLLDDRYPPAQIGSLLNSDVCDARKCAALALALVGRADCVPSLVEHLRDPDPMVNEMAEHALWSVWFRGGDREANARLAHGCDAMNRRDVNAAVEHLSAAVALCPDFAEAWNQRAIAYYLQERFEESLEDCRRATTLMPCHFGAWAGLGHCHASLGRFAEALEAYRRALAINPHLECVAEMVASLDRRDASDAGDTALGDGGSDELRIVSDADKKLCDWDVDELLDLDDEEDDASQSRADDFPGVDAKRGDRP